MKEHILYTAIWRNIQFDKKIGGKDVRKTFLEPELEVIKFGTEDIITTSFVNDGSQDGNLTDPNGEDTDTWD